MDVVPVNNEQPFASESLFSFLLQLTDVVVDIRHQRCTLLVGTSFGNAVCSISNSSFSANVVVAPKWRHCQTLSSPVEVGWKTVRERVHPRPVK